MKAEFEITQKLTELCAIDATVPPKGATMEVYIGGKVGAVKALLWVLGINDDDSFHVTAKPGPPVKIGEPC